jgi:tetratricopeptide (TPR) repeat protein
MRNERKKKIKNGSLGAGPSSCATLFICMIVVLSTVAASPENGDSDSRETPRQLYNSGTEKLKDGKLREAENYLQGAVSSQDEKVQGSALYNLGHVRFKAGVEELKKSPDGNSAGAYSKQALDVGDGAIKALDEALVNDDVKAMVAAYQRGRGARKELKGATEAVKRAMQTYGSVLSKWQRASGDFKSTVELNSSDKDAQTNAELVDRSIAKLVDTQRMMMQNKGDMDKQREELRQKMKQLKGKIPQEQAPPGGPGGDEEDDDEEDQKPKEPKAGMQEGPSKDGKERQLTPEEAERLLGMLKLDGNRKLPLGMKETGEKNDQRKRKDW